MNIADLRRHLQTHHPRARRIIKFNYDFGGTELSHTVEVKKRLTFCRTTNTKSLFNLLLFILPTTIIAHAQRICLK